VYVVVILAFVTDIMRCKEAVLQVSKAYDKKELLNCEITNVDVWLSPAALNCLLHVWQPHIQLYLSRY
jgi:hypothetical protein